MDGDPHRKENTLLAALSRRGKVAVAFSGGTDSTYLLAAALDALGPGRVLALVADTPLQRSGEAGEALALARSLGAEARVEALDPLLLPDVAENGRDRCYHCKRALLTRFLEVAGEADLLEGSNADDLACHRPGKRALEELGVASPLAEAGLGKEEIRELSRRRGLPTADRPSSPCLATRFPYGADITVEALRRVEAGERVLAEAGLSPHRLRDHGDTARLELPPALFPRLLSDGVRERVTERLRALGWRQVVLDLRGLRSGSFDEGPLPPPRGTVL